VIAFLFAFALALAAEPSLDDVLTSVDRHFPLLIAAEAKAELALGEQMQAAGGFDPLVNAKGWWKQGEYDQTYFDAGITQATPLWGASVRGGWRMGLGSFAVYDGWYDTLDRGELYAELNLPLLKGGFTDELRTEIQATRSEVAAAQARIDLSRIRYAFQARSAWYSWLAAGEKLRVADEQLSRAKLAVDAARKRVDAGDLAPLGLVDARRVLTERAASQQSADLKLRQAAMKLGLYLRDGSGQPIVLTGAPPRLPAPDGEPVEVTPELIDRARTHRPDVLALQATTRAEEARLKLARVSVLPKLDFQLEFAGDVAAEDESAKPVDIKVGGKLEVPLALRTGRGKLQSSRAKVDTLRAEQQYLLDQVSVEVNNTVMALDVALERAVLAEENEDLARQLEDAARIRYQLGDDDLFALYLREQSTFSAASRRIDAWLDWHLASAALLAATGDR
jgi:outer membrane protein TolC